MSSIYQIEIIASFLSVSNCIALKTHWFAVTDVGERLVGAVSSHGLCTWIKQYGIPAEKRVLQQDHSAEVKRLLAQLKRVTVNFRRM